MIIHDVPQGSVAWLQLRLGRPTASEFDKIVTPGGKISEGRGRRSYLLWLATERLLNRPLESIDNLEWVARGKEMEPAASAAYEFLEEVQLATVGFITTDDGRAGASPDRLIPSCNAAVELKCPAPHTHLGYLVDGFETNYIVQAQAQIWIGRFDYVDRYSYHPEMPPALTRTKPDKHFQTLFDSEIPRFCDDLDALIEKARACGEFVPNAILA